MMIASFTSLLQFHSHYEPSSQNYSSLTCNSPSCLHRSRPTLQPYCLLRDTIAVVLSSLFPTASATVATLPPPFQAADTTVATLPSSFPATGTTVCHLHHLRFDFSTSQPHRVFSSHPRGNQSSPAPSPQKPYFPDPEGDDVKQVVWHDQ
ncbi:hypothetical protein RJT34_07969 [Clitoria ternatea]|uniref:Uncharacterized protein n=1 Tax=Clitoria ternatea TaxID=43366 RepID=A0AAN9K5Y0_CLITE